MTGVDALHAQAMCEDVFHAFHSLIDEGRASEAITLFTEDGTLEVRGRRYEGRDAILGFLAEREARADRRTRHAGTNFRFRPKGADRADAVALLIVFAVDDRSPPPSAPEAVSDCEMTFRRDDNGRWRMSSRRHVRFAPDPRDETST